MQFINAAPVSFSVGQVSGLGTGAYLVDISAMLFNYAASASMVGRIGNAQMVKRINVSGFVQQQSANVNTTKFKVHFFICDDMNSAMSTLLTDIYRASATGTVIDYNSSRDTSFEKNCVLLSEHDYTLHGDDFSGQTLKYLNFNFTTELDARLDWNSASASLPINRRYLLAILADGGNSSPSTISTVANAPITAINTGFAGIHQAHAYVYDC